jgi:hypothetical protein
MPIISTQVLPATTLHTGEARRNTTDFRKGYRHRSIHDASNV